MQTRYLIDAIRIADAYTRNGPSRSTMQPLAPLYLTDADQRWFGTYTAREDAERAYQHLAADKTCVAAALIEWRPGRRGGSVRHGSYADRSCAGGVPIQTVLRHGDRTWVSASVGQYISYTLDDWQDHEPGDVHPTTQPAPGYRLHPRMSSVIAA